jgi:hypothetical protein
MTSPQAYLDAVGRDGTEGEGRPSRNAGSEGTGDGRLYARDVWGADDARPRHPDNTGQSGLEQLPVAISIDPTLFHTDSPYPESVGPLLKSILATSLL